MLLGVTLDYKVTIINSLRCWCKKQKYRSVEHGRKPRDKPTQLWSIIIYDKGGKNIQ